MANLYALTVGAARLGRDKFLEGILIYSRTMGERVSARRRRASERASELAGEPTDSASVSHLNP